MGSLMVYFNEKFLSIEYDEKLNCVLMNWKSYASNTDYRKGLEKGLELAKEKNLTKWVTDQTNMSGIKKEEQIWAYQDWFPRVMESGIKYMAIIIPENPLTQFTVNNILKHVDLSRIQIQFFERLTKAKKWIADKQ